MTETTQPSDTVEIEDLDQFISLLAAWHANKVNTLKHMLTMPEGFEMLVDGKEPVAMVGDMLAGFKAGIELALMELGSLPFAAEIDEPIPQA